MSATITALDTNPVTSRPGPAGEHPAERDPAGDQQQLPARRGAERGDHEDRRLAGAAEAVRLAAQHQRAEVEHRHRVQQRDAEQRDVGPRRPSSTHRRPRRVRRTGGPGWPSTAIRTASTSSTTADAQRSGPAILEISPVRAAPPTTATSA